MTTDRDDGERHERIRARAYAIWEQQGRPEGKGLENWLRAKRLVDAEDLRAVARWLTSQAQAGQRPIPRTTGRIEAERGCGPVPDPGIGRAATSIGRIPIRKPRKQL
jgi:hypothetical protein